jgi:ribonuclease HII
MSSNCVEPYGQVGGQLNNGWIVGVDECSYGSWVGHVWAAAVILKEPIEGLNDSKKLSPSKRSFLADKIKAEAVSCGVGYATALEIAEMGALKASHEAMLRALQQLTVPIEKIFIDGNKIPKWIWPTQAIIKGDGIVPSIMAASILAKTARTEEMAELAKKHPEYGFDQHQGYGTAQHAKALVQFGVLPEHRHSYAPIKAILNKKISP